MNYIFAGLIIAAWLFLVITLGWNTNDKPWKNIITGVERFVILGIVYWIPFWLIFLK